MKKSSGEKKKWHELWQARVGLLVTILSVIGILLDLPKKFREAGLFVDNKISTDQSAEKQNELSLTAYIHGTEGASDLLDYGKVRIRLGQYRLEPRNVDNNGEVYYEGIPAIYGDDSVQLELLNRPYSILNQTAYFINESKRITFEVTPKNIEVRGTVYDNGKRISGAILEIDSGVARDTTDITGNFNFTVPKGEGDFSNLTILYNGVERFNRRVMLTKSAQKFTLDPL